MGWAACCGDECPFAVGHWVQFLTVVTLQFTNMFVENLRLIERNGLPGASEHHFHVSGSECILNIMVSKAYTYTPCNHHGYVEGMTLRG